MKKTIASLALLLMCGAAHAQTSQTFGAFMAGLPSATAPLNDSDAFYVLQSGTSAKVTRTDLVRSGVVIAPVAGSFNQAINTTQTITGTTSGYQANAFAINSDDANLGTNFGVGYIFTHVFGGSSMLGGREAVTVFMTNNAASSASNTNRNYVAFTAIVNAVTGDGGTDPASGAKGAFFAIAPVAVACGTADTTYNCTNQPAASNLLELTGAEVNISAHTGSSMKYKGGVTIVARTDDLVQGSTYDCSLCLSNQIGAVGFQDAILIGNMNSAHPVTATGTIIATVGSSTVARGLDFASYTFTGNEIQFSNFVVTSLGGVAAGSNISVPANNTYQFASRTLLFSPSDGILELTNNAATGFTRLQLGGTTSSFPAIKVNGPTINIRLADDSDDAALSASNVVVLGNLTQPLKTPVSAAAACTATQMEWDANFLYVCTASGAWKRVAIATWP